MFSEPQLTWIEVLRARTGAAVGSWSAGILLLYLSTLSAGSRDIDYKFLVACGLTLAVVLASALIERERGAGWRSKSTFGSACVSALGSGMLAYSLVDLTPSGPIRGLSIALGCLTASSVSSVVSALGISLLYGLVALGVWALLLKSHFIPAYVVGGLFLCATSLWQIGRALATLR